MHIYPYKAGSASAKALATALGAKRLRQEGPRKAVGAPFLINWGASSFKREIVSERVLNPPAAITVAINKLTAFQAMGLADVSIPNFTEDRQVAEGYIAEGKKVVCRTNLRGYGGDGIVIAETAAELVDAPLYVKYIPKEHEYRVHVMNGEVFFVQRKARKLDVPDDQVNWRVRNLAGGFIYANQNVDVAESVRVSAVGAVRSLRLDFGAVDILVHRSGQVYVLEVNCAPGLAGSTLTRYTEAFQRIVT